MSNNSINTPIKLRLLAYCQALLLLTIVGSGMLFAHKHQLSSGEVVVHIHPYNFKKDPMGQKHKHSASELHFLDVVFQGQYIGADFIKVGTPWEKILFTNTIKSGTPEKLQKPLQFCLYLRGPPLPFA